MNNTKAAELYKLSLESKDIVETVLKIMLITKDASVEDILETYLSIKKGKLKIVEVITASPLKPIFKKKLESLISSELSEKPIFLYLEDKNILGGFIVKLDDNILDKSIQKKILELSLN